MNKTYRRGWDFKESGEALKKNPLFGICATMVLFLTTCLIYGFQFNYLSPDDVFFSYTEQPSYSLALANYVNGRFIPGVAYHLFAELDWQIHEFWIFLQPFTYLAFSIFSCVFISKLCGELSWSKKTICALVILSFPYLITIFANKNNQLNTLICFSFLSAAIYFFSHRNKKFYTFASITSLFIVFASYQTLTYFFIVFVIGKCLFDNNIRGNISTIVIGLFVYVTAAISYYIPFSLVSSWALLEMASTENEPLIQFYGKLRSSGNDLLGFVESLKSYAAAIVRVLIVPEPILPIALKVITLNFLSAAFFIRSFSARQSPHARPENGKLRQRTVVIILILLLSSPIHLFIENNWYNPRAISHAGAIWAVVLLFVMQNAPPAWAKLPTVGAAVYACALCFYVASTTHHMQQLTEKDHRLAFEIIDEIRTSDLYDPSKPVAIVGLLGPNSSYMSNERTYFEINPGLFGRDWSKYGALQMAAGSKILRAPREFLLTAEEACKGQPKSSRNFQTYVVGHGAIVCLNNERN